MYLKRTRTKDGYHYIIRDTYRDKGEWKHRDLLDLGKNPAEWINYSERNGFYFSPEIEETLDSLGQSYSSGDLEELFLPYLDPRIRRIIERSGNRHTPYLLSKSCNIEEIRSYQNELHAFDVRRLHYLKFGHVDMGNIQNERSWKFLKVLSCKCRDEIEATFDLMEKELPRREISSYLYTAFHLQRYFSHHILKNYPLGLNMDEIDDSFMAEICQLNHDPEFFKGVDQPGNGTLHPYLTKYVWMHFDHSFEPEYPWHGFRADFNRRNYYKGLPKKPSLMLEEAYTLFGISHEKFIRLKKADLVRLYRRKAKKIHPDTGGDHDDFVKLTEAYELLVEVKQQKNITFSKL